ncbi:MAG: iron-containing redox enzyme family protein [Actinomycetota bacterium]|nr:iron-containing redox enzyme family protein [Actinomycetota bacterium]
MDPDRVEKELADVMNSQWFEDRPFLRDFAAGKVPLENLARFGPSYPFQVDQFKRFVAAVYANAEPRDVRELMLENLEEEHGEGEPMRDHAHLVARFVRALGADVPDPFNVEPIPESRQWVDRILKICMQEHFVVGLAALSFGIEARTRTMAFLGQIYRDAYGIADENLEFFFMHLETDEEHAGRAISLVRKYCDTEELLERSKWAVREVLDATRVVSEGMERVCS